MYLYNSLTHKKELFVPNDPSLVKMYTCGPTVYHYAHIGNLRTYIMEDVLEKSLRYLGYPVKRVMNITDVGHLASDADTGEDKMLKGARREHKTVMEIAKYYTDAFFADCDKLNIKRPDVVESATNCIPEYIHMVQTLLDKGFAYLAGGNVYFDTSTLKQYYVFNDHDEEDLEVGVRAHNLPGIQIVLKQAHLAALNDGVGFLVLQKHPDYRGLGHIGFDLRHHRQIPRVPHQVVRKAGAIIVIDLRNPGLNRGRASGRGKHREIAALGMSAQPQRITKLCRRLPDVGLGQQLGRNGLLEGHVEVLLPAYKRVVRPPERQHHAVIGQQEGHRGKLGFPLRNQHIPVKYHPAAPESAGAGRRPEQLRVVFRPDTAFAVLVGKKILRRVPQSDGNLRTVLDPSHKGNVGQSGKNQRIHPIERALCKGQIAPPLEIIKHICHTIHLVGVIIAGKYE